MIVCRDHQNLCFHVGEVCIACKISFPCCNYLCSLTSNTQHVIITTLLLRIHYLYTKSCKSLHLPLVLKSHPLADAWCCLLFVLDQFQLYQLSSTLVPPFLLWHYIGSQVAEPGLVFCTPSTGRQIDVHDTLILFKEAWLSHRPYVKCLLAAAIISYHNVS